MRSLLSIALCLSLIDRSFARIPLLARQDLEERGDNGVGAWFNKLFTRSEKRQSVQCFEDDYYTFVQQPSGQDFCQAYMNYPNVTVVVDITPKTTIRTIDSTQFVTQTIIVRTTPVSTVTVTAGAPSITGTPFITARQAAGTTTDIVTQFFSSFESQASSAGLPVSSNELSASFSSACACQTYGGSTVLAPYTDAATTVTINGFLRTVVTSTAIRTAAPIVTTVTVTPKVSTTSIVPVSIVPPNTPISAPLLSTGTPTPTTGTTPIGLSFACPQNNGSTISQLIGSERFDYLIMCDMNFPNDDTFYAELAYDSFAECAAACSMADALFDESFCEVAVFSSTPDVNGYNCLLKPSASVPAAAPGIHAAILQAVALGIDAADPSGTATDTPTKFASVSSTALVPTSQISSSLSSLMGNGSSTSIPLITPAPLLAAGRAVDAISYTTIVSDGSTFSTGSAFSTYYTSNGSWYAQYYSTWSVAWQAATTVYAIGSQQTEVASSNNTQTTVEQTGGGGYVTVQNTTTITYTYLPGEVIANTTDTIISSSFYANGTFITATTVIINSVATSLNGNSSDNAGGSGGGSGSGASGALPSSFSTVSVTTVSPVPSTIVAGPGSTLIPSQTATSSATTIPISEVPSSILDSNTTVNSFNSQGSTGGGASGGIPTSPAITSGNTVITASPSITIETFMSNGSTGGGASGGIPTSPAITSGNTATTASPSITIETFMSNGSTGNMQSGGLPSSSVASSGTEVNGTFTPSQTVVLTTGSPSVVVTSFNSQGSTGTAASGGIPSSSTDEYCPPDASTCTGLRTGFQPSPPASSDSTTSGPPVFSYPGYTPPSSSSPSTGTAPVSSPASSGLSSAPSSSVPTSSATPSTDSSSPVSTPTDNRSGSQSPSTDSSSPVSTPTDIRSGSQSPSTSTTPSTTSGPPIFSYPGYVPPASSSSESSPVSTPTDNRSGSQSPSTSIPSGAGSTSSAPSSSVPSSTAPSGTGSISSAPSSSFPISTAPSGTGSDSTTPTGSYDTNNRSGFQSPPPSSTDTSTSSSSVIPTYPYTGYQPPFIVTSSSTAMSSSSPPFDFSNSGGDRTGLQTPPGTDTSFLSTGGMSSFASGSIPVSASLPSNTVPISASVPSSFVPSSTGDFSNSGGDRTGIQTPPGTGTGSFSLPPASLFTLTAPTSPSSGLSTPVSPTTYPPPLSSFAPNCTVGTTTVFTTVTLYGCWNQCSSSAAYIPPQAFGQVNAPPN